MKTLITRIKRLALALCFVTPLVSWANTDLQVTITDNTVVIDNDNAAQFDHMTFTVSSPVVTIPASETLPLGTQIELTSIAFGKRASGSGNTRPNTLSITGTDGTVYTSEAIVESGTFTNAGCTKEVYSFADKGCVLTVGLSYAMSFKNSDGSDFGTLVGRTAKNSASLFGTTVYNPSYTVWLPVQELKGEIVGSTSFTLLTGALTDIRNTDTTKPAYLHNATGWISTSTASSGEIKLVNGPAGYALSVNNGNSLGSGTPNRTSVWKKLTGDGTLTTGDNNWQTPAVKIYDASEFTGSINASAGNVYLAVIFCAEADTFSPSVYGEIGSKSGLIYIKPGTSVTVAEGATWTAVNGIVNKGTLIVNGTVASPISNNGGTVTVNAGATISGFGATRDFTGITVDSSVPVKLAMTTEEYGKGSVSVTGANGISSITVLAPDGTTEVGTITPEEGAGTLETGVKTSGLSTWCDYEFNGDKSNTGVDKTGLTSDVNTTTYPEIFNSSMLYTYTHPWRNISYPNSWTAVVRCTVPELENAIVVMFGTYGAGAIGLVAGSNPEEEMLLVSTPGSTATTSEDKHFTTLATMSVKDATTAQHVYVFTKDGTTVNVYCDGEKVLEDYQLASATLGGGLQVGSLHGGVVQGEVHTGLVRFGAGESQISSLTPAQQQNARIDCMRMFDYIVSPEQIAALSVEFPAVKLYRATAAADADTTWGDLSWTPAWDGGNTQSKVILTTEGDATVALPDSITVDEVQLDLETGSTLTLVGPGTLTITQPITIEDGTLELTGTVTLTQDTALNGSVKFTEFTKDGAGAIKLSNGATVGVDAALVVTPLGTYTCAEGTVADAAYSSGEGDVKLIPLTSAVVSITQGETTLYYSDLDTALGPLVNAPGSISEDVQVTLLNGTTLPFTYDTFLMTAGYYIDGNVITKAVAQIGTTTYPTLAAAVGAAADGATVTLLRASSEAITLNKAITLSETANFSGTLTGNGTLTFKAFRNNPSITFDNWTGTVVLPEFAAAATVLNKYGVAGSTVVLKGITGGWLGETSTQKMDVAPVLQLDGNVTIKGFSTSWDYTFAELAGTGNFVLDPTDNSPKSATITKVAEDFSGIITNNTTKTLSIGTLARQAGQTTTSGTKLLDVGGTGEIVASALTVGGEASEVEMITKADGIYVLTYYTITVEATNATVTDIEDKVREDDTDISFTVAADTNYKVTSVEVNGVEVGNAAGQYNATLTGDTTITVTTELDVKTFTVTIPDNTEISVQGATLVEGNTYTAQIGAEVTITYTAVGNYVVKGGSQTIEVTAGTETVNKPEGMTVNPAVAQIGADLFETLQAAVDQGDVTVKILGDVTLTEKLVVDGGQTVVMTADSAVTVTGQLRVVDGSSCTIGENVTITSASHPTVFVLGDPAVKTAGTAKSTLVVNGKVLNTNTGFDKTFAIAGNGLDTQGVDITIGATGEVRNANGIAIYQAFPGSLVINGTVAGASAVSIKDGTLTVNEGAVVTATLADGLAYVGNGNGESPTGDAIIAPYYPLSKGYGTPVVSILGGTITVTDTTNCTGIEAYDFEGTTAPQDAATNVNVSGGEFNTPVAEVYCASGYIPTYDGQSGTYGVKEGAYVARVGDVGYETLQAAVDQGDVTVKILGDVTLTDKLVVSNKTVTITADSAVTVTGQLRVVDGSSCTIGENVTITSASHPTVFVLGDPAVKTAGTAKSTLVVNGTVLNTNAGFDKTFAIAGNGLDTMGVDITINGTVRNANGIAIYQAFPGNLVVNGTVEGASAISIKDGTLTVNDGAEITATLASGAAYVGNNNGESPTGDAIIAPYYPLSKGYGTPVVSIVGGTITVTDTTNCTGIEAYDFEGTTAPQDAATNVNVEGGLFNTPVAKVYCADGYEPKDNGDGTYTVVEKSGTEPGKDDGKTYVDEAAAEAAAETVTVSVPAAVSTALTDDQETAYKALFKGKVVAGETEGTYKVVVALTTAAETTLQAAVDAEAENLATAAVAAAADATNGGEATVATTPGLYYVVEAGADIGSIVPASCTLATGATTKLTIPNKGTSGFYKISVSVTDVPVTTTVEP